MNTFVPDIQAIHNLTRYLLRAITIIFCTAILVAVIQEAAGSIVRSVDKSTKELAIQTTINHVATGESAFYFGRWVA